jgi:hypothetical protein
MRYLLAFIAVVFMSSTLDAQFSIRLGFNLDRQPVWGPTGYDHAEYYYLPDIEVYYNIPQRMYYYNERGRWIGRSTLPSRYRGFDLYNSYKVVLNERTPYRNHNKYRDQYASYKGRHDQQPIRDARDSKYYVNPNHPEHKNWVKQQQQEKNKNQGNNKNNNRGKKSGRN